MFKCLHYNLILLNLDFQKSQYNNVDIKVIEAILAIGD